MPTRRPRRTAVLRAIVDLNAANAGRELPKLAARIGLDS